MRPRRRPIEQTRPSPRDTTRINDAIRVSRVRLIDDDGAQLGIKTTDEAREQPDGEMFVPDITEVVIVGLNAEATKLVVESWTPERGLQKVERD